MSCFTKKEHTRRSLGKIALGVAAATMISGSPAISQDKPTLQAIFLPATWGVVVRDVLAPQYEEETGIKV